MNCALGPLRAATTIALCLLFAGCSSDAHRGSNNRRSDFTLVPPGTYPPLPSTYLLGAATQLQRDDITEAVLRHFASKQFKYRFIAFEAMKPDGMTRDRDC